MANLKEGNGEAVVVGEDKEREREGEREGEKERERERQLGRGVGDVGLRGTTLPSDVAGNTAWTGSASSSVTHSKLQALQAAQ